MRGVRGIYEYRSRAAVDESVLNDMVEVIRHRGPDEGGVHVDVGLGIGMRRLSIIDLPGGKQPMANEDGSIVVVFVLDEHDRVVADHGSLIRGLLGVELWYRLFIDEDPRSRLPSRPLAAVRSGSP